jgi:hypothetical protein
MTTFIHLLNATLAKAISVITVCLLSLLSTTMAVEVSFLPVNETAREANQVPGKIKLVRNNSTAALTVKISLNTGGTATIKDAPGLPGPNDFSIDRVISADRAELTFSGADPDTDPVNFPYTANVTFPLGVEEMMLEIKPIDDTAVETKEYLSLEIRPIYDSAQLRYTISSPSGMSVFISDNDHKARIELPDPIADEDAVRVGLVGDEDIDRRGVMRIRFDEFAATTFSRNLEIEFVTNGGTQPIAELNQDYKVHYKTCGNDSGGVTEDTSRIGFDKNRVLGTGLGYSVMAALIGDEEVPIKISDDDEFTSGFSLFDEVSFNNHDRLYVVYEATNEKIKLGDWFEKSGAVAVTAGSDTITGNINAQFTTEFSVGSHIRIGGTEGQVKTIASIIDDRNATVTSNFLATYTLASIEKLERVPLVESLPNGTEITIESGSGGDTDSVEMALAVYGKSRNKIKVGGGSGGLFEGDVFQVPDQTPFYVMTQDTGSLIPKGREAKSGTIQGDSGSRFIEGTGINFENELIVGDYLYLPSTGPSATYIGRVVKIIDLDSIMIDYELETILASTSFSVIRPGTDGEITFRRYQGGGSSGSGLDADVTSNADIITLIPATFTGKVMRLLVPPESKKVEISIAPRVNPDGAEGVEEVRMAIRADEDYEIITPQVGSVFIADRDLTAAIKVKANAGLPKQAGFFLIELQGGTFNRSVNIPFTITQSDGGSQYKDALPNFVTFVSGQTSAEIQVDPITTITNPALAVKLTLDSSLSYKRVGSDSSSVNPSAIMDISESVGTVSLVASDPVAQENPVISAANYGEFTLTINRQRTNAVSVTLNVSGTAVVGSRYEFLTATDDVITPVNDQIKVTIPSGTGSTSSTVIKIRSKNNFQADGNQIVQLTAVDGSSYLVGTPSIASVTIQDDEPTISVVATSNAARPSTPGYFTFSYSGTPTTQPITVNFKYSGTAVRNTDFTSSASVVIPTGRTSEMLAINPEDNGDRTAKTVTVTMETSDKYNIGTGAATIQINAQNEPSRDKTTPGTVSSGSSGGGCGLGSGFSTFALFGLLALYFVLRRREA